MNSILVAIEPPEELAAIIMSVREKADRITPVNYYRQTPPHITLFVNTFPSVESVDGIVSAIAERHARFNAVVAGIHSFGYDANTKLHTLVYRVEDTPELRFLQQEVVKGLNAIRTPEQAEKHLKRQDITEEQKINLQNFGFLYSPEKWTFHATIGSFPEEHFAGIVKLAQEHEFRATWTVDSVCVYTKPKDLRVLHRKYCLNGTR